MQLTWVDPEILIQSKESQIKKDKHPMMLLICGVLKNDTNELMYKTETDSQTLKTKVWLPKGKGGNG